MINYEELLKKYMKLVAQEEGMTFLNWIEFNKNFTNEEIHALKTIEKEVCKS